MVSSPLHLRAYFSRAFSRGLNRREGEDMLSKSFESCFLVELHFRFDSKTNMS